MFSSIASKEPTFNLFTSSSSSYSFASLSIPRTYHTLLLLFIVNMASLVKKESRKSPSPHSHSFRQLMVLSFIVQPTLLPTPSPSPPSLSQPLPYDASTSSRRTYSQAERQAHLALARQCADQLRRLHLANGAEVDAQSDTKERKAERYHVELERLEGEKKVMRRVAVIIPSGQTKEFKQVSIPSYLPFRFRRLLTPPASTASTPRPHSRSSTSPRDPSKESFPLS